MAYRNKTFVSFDGDDIRYYRLMTAWIENEEIDFSFYNAHDMQQARDTSKPETIRASLRERLANTKQVVLIVSDTTKSKAADPKSFLYYEVEVIERLKLPVVFVNINNSKKVQSNKIPTKLSGMYTISVPFRAKVVQYALDNFPDQFTANLTATTPKTGPHQYVDSVYEKLGL